MDGKAGDFESHHDCMDNIERSVFPLKEPAKSFRDYCNPSENVLVIVTSNTKLCSSHVYHELNRTHRGRFMLFEHGCYLKSHEVVEKSFADDTSDYIVLVMENKDSDFIQESVLFNQRVGKAQKRGILIVDAEYSQLKPKWETVLDYQWDELSIPFKDSIMGKTVRFKTQEFKLIDAIDERELSEIIQSEDLSRLMDKGGFTFDDGMNLISRGYNENCYIERSFTKETFKRDIFNVRSGVFLVTGLRKEDVKVLGIKEWKIQWMAGSNDELMKFKEVFLTVEESEAGKIFEDVLQKKFPEVSVAWFHYLNGEFIIRRSRGKVRLLNTHRKVEVLSEMQLIQVPELRGEKIILISDDPGMGKSTTITSLIKKIKETQPDCWIGRLDLADIEKESNSEEIGVFLIKMFGMRTALEVKLFEYFLKSPVKKQIFFDGFDEVRPSLRPVLSNHFQALKKYPGTQIWISTRSNKKAELEVEFGAFSYTMEQLKSEDQAWFLDRFWKDKLKSEGVERSTVRGERTAEMIHEKLGAILTEMECFRAHDSQIVESLENLNVKLQSGELCKILSKIDELDFTSYARELLSNVFHDNRNILGRFPLHLFMLGELAYKENLKLYSCHNVHDLYSDFVTGKVRIYVGEKCSTMQETEAVEQVQAIIERHKEIAVTFMRMEILSWHKGCNLMRCLLNVGMVAEFGDGLRFTHRMFAEYFFSEWLVENARMGKLDKIILEEVFLESRFRAVRWFLENVFQRKDKELAFSEGFLKGFDPKRIFGRFIAGTDRMELLECVHVWQNLVGTFKKISDQKLVDELVSVVAETLHGFLHDAKIIEAFKLLDYCLSDELLIKVFDKVIGENLYILMAHASTENVSGILLFLKRILCIKACRASPDVTLNVSLQENQEEVDRLFETVREPYGIQETVKMLKEPREMNVFHQIPLNCDPNIFSKVLMFVKEILGEELLVEQLTWRQPWEDDFLKCCVLSEAHTIAAMMQVMRGVLKESSCIRIFKDLDEHDTNFLLFATIDETLDKFLEIMEQMRVLASGSLLKDIILSRNQFEENILHYAALNKDIRMLEEVVKVAWSCADAEEFAKFITCQDEDGSTVFHERNTVSFSDLSFLEKYIDKGKLSELLTKVNVLGDTCLHNSALGADCLAGNLRFVTGILEGSSLEDFLLRANGDGNTFLHSAAIRGKGRGSGILDAAKRILSQSTFSKLMEARNNNGKLVGEILGEGE